MKNQKERPHSFIPSPSRRGLGEVIQLSLSFIFILAVLFLTGSAHAIELIRPIPNTTGDQVITNLNYHKPSITFGQILDGTYANLNQSPRNLTNAKEILTALNESSRQSLAEFNNRQTDYLINRLPTTENRQPTPYLPIPNLISAVSNFVISPTPMINPKLQQVLASQNSLTGNLYENPIKNLYSIAVLGDSMVDTLGEGFPALADKLNESFPAKSFAIFNYGQGATDLESGLFRLTNGTNYLDKYYPPLLSYKPDILVVESFAYNHWGGQKYDLDRQWLGIAKILDTIHHESPFTQVILAATIAPNSKIFGDGKLNWPTNLKSDSATITKAYLQNMINFAVSENYPVADAYHASLGTNGEGLPIYINNGDHLHPSPEGAKLFAEKIVETIKINNLIL